MYFRCQKLGLLSCLTRCCLTLCRASRGTCEFVSGSTILLKISLLSRRFSKMNTYKSGTTIILVANVLSVVAWQHNITRFTQNSTCLITLAMLSKDGGEQQQPPSALRLTIIIGMQGVLIGEHYMYQWQLFQRVSRGNSLILSWCAILLRRTFPY